MAIALAIWTFFGILIGIHGERRYFRFKTKRVKVDLLEELEPGELYQWNLPGNKSQRTFLGSTNKGEYIFEDVAVPDRFSADTIGPEHGLIIMDKTLLVGRLALGEVKKVV